MLIFFFLNLDTKCIQIIKSKTYQLNPLSTMTQSPFKTG